MRIEVCQKIASPNRLPEILQLSAFDYYYVGSGFQLRDTYLGGFSDREIPKTGDIL